MGEVEAEAEQTEIPPMDPMAPDAVLEERPRVMARDPVCGVDVDPIGAAASVEHRGVPYYFCSLTCKAEFEADPVRYAG
jgi:YHS domain-containing protein